MLSLLAIGIHEIAVILGVAESQGGVLQTLSGLLILAGCCMLGFGLLSKYSIHPGLPVRKSRALRWSFAGTALAAGIAILISILIPAFNAARRAGTLQAFETSDGQLHVQVPIGWEPRTEPITGNVRLSLWAPITKSYFQVFTEDKSATNGMSLHAYTAAMRDLMKGSFTNTSMSDPLSVAIGGRHGLAYEAHGVSDGAPLGMFVVILDDENCFRQLRASTTEDNFASQRAEFERIIGTCTLAR